MRRSSLIVFLLLAAGSTRLNISVLAAGTPKAIPALVGSTAPFHRSAVCAKLSCVFDGVRRATLEGSGNPVRIYGYGLRAGGRVEVTRYDLKGQRGDGLAYRLLFTQTAPQNTVRTAGTAAQLATAAAGYPVTTEQIAACWQGATSAKSNAWRLLAARGFDAPGVHCARREGQLQLLVILTN